MYFIVGNQSTSFNDEKKLITAFATMFQQLDPDIILGYEIHMNSIGYLLERATVLGLYIEASHIAK